MWIELFYFMEIERFSSGFGTHQILSKEAPEWIDMDSRNKGFEWFILVCSSVISTLDCNLI